VFSALLFAYNFCYIRKYSNAWSINSRYRSTLLHVWDFCFYYQ